MMVSVDDVCDKEKNVQMLYLCFVGPVWQPLFTEASLGHNKCAEK